MKKLTLLIVVVVVTGISIAAHQVVSGDAAAARAPLPPASPIRTVRPPANGGTVDLARATLERGNKLMERGKDAEAAAYFRACLALEGVAGDAWTFRNARTGLATAEERIAEQSRPRNTRKGTVTTLAPKAIATEPVVPPTPQPRFGPAVGPDGVLYESAP